MALGRQGIWAGALGLALAGMNAVAQPPAGQSAQTTAPTAQQNVPDAPRPQTLPTLNTLTPAGPALPNAPAAAPGSDTATADNGGAAPGTALPSAPAQTAADAEQGPPPEQGVKAFVLPSVNVNFVEIPFTVKDSKGHLVPGLTWRDVRVYENGLRQQMRVFTVDPFPLSVAIVIDQSVTFDTMDKINASLSALQGAFTPYDEIALFTYNNGVTKQTDFTAAQSARLGVILDRSKGKGRDPVWYGGGPLSQTTTKNNEQVDPNTAPLGQRGGQSFQMPEKEYHTLNDAILAAAQETAHAAKGRRRIVYVISDGKEYGSTAKEKDVIHYLQANQVAVYATLVGDSAIPGMGFLDHIHLPYTMRDNALPRFVAATGGEWDAEFRPRGIENSFARISEEVRTQYTVGYYSHEPMIDGKFRSVDVRVLRPNLDVIAKKGYYPSASSGPAAPTTPSATP